ncbi:sugar kinase [Aestuariimicrobium soli]|uniref:sugar kinase n=1 Tax=Aestuariimicrobium soli TaxID=2035834 RepID=UPI003EB894FF
MGETMISLRAGGPAATAPTWTTHVAGAESNVAIALARLGHPVRWYSRVGDDAFGRLIVRELTAEGVEVAAELDPDRPTGHMFLMPTSFGSSVDYHRAGSAASALRPEPAVADLRASAPSLVVLSGITPALGPDAREATLAVASAARALGCDVVLDVNHRTKLWSREQARPTLRELAAHASVVVGSPDELTLIADSPAAALELGPSLVVEKLGERGCRVTTHDGATEVPTIAVPEVDPVGAGDAFTAGLVSGLLEGLSPVEAARRGTLLGCACVRHRGDWEGLPTRAELQAELARRDRGSSDDVSR